ARTATNVTAAAVSSTVVARQTGLLDEAIFAGRAEFVESEPVAGAPPRVAVPVVAPRVAMPMVPVPDVPLHAGARRRPGVPMTPRTNWGPRELAVFADTQPGGEQ